MRIFIVSILIGVGIVAIYCAGKGFLFELDWELVSEASSPNETMKILYYRSKSEAGHAPYGDHLVLKSWGSFPYSRADEVFFAGYCGGGVGYQWIGNEKIEISCPQAGEIRTLFGTFNGIKLQIHVPNTP